MHRPLHVPIQLLIAMVLAVAVAGVAHAQDDQGGADLGPPTSSTEVLGTPSVDLRGVWLVVSHGNIAPGRVRNTVDLYDIESDGGGLKVDLVLRELPKPWKDALEVSNKQLEEWGPSKEQVAELARTLDSLPPIDPNRYTRHAAKVVAPDHYADADIEGALPTDGSLVALKMQHAFRPRPANQNEAQLMSDDVVFVVNKAEPTQLEGEHVRMMLAAGFLPIPVKLEGPFVMYRLRGPGEASAGGGGWLARIWDSLTRGCH
jgi:hypothetical protein